MEFIAQQFVDQIAAAVVNRLQAHVTNSVSQKLMSVEDAAIYLGRTARAVEHLIARGAIPVTRIDGRRQIDRAALDKIIADRTYFEC